MNIKTKPRLLVTAKEFRRGKLVATAEGSNAFTAAGVDYVLTALTTNARFGTSGAVGQRGFSMVLAASRTASASLQSSPAPWVPVRVAPFGYRTPFRATGSEITGINAVQIRNVDTILARINLADLTFTSTTGTNPFVANATKAADATWEITWRIAVNVPSMTGLTSQERSALADLFAAYLTDSEYLNDHRNIIRAKYTQGRNTVNIPTTQGIPVVTTDPATNIVLVEVSAPGPATRFSNRVWTIGLDIRRARSTFPLARLASQNVGTTAAGGTFSCRITFL